ncbi:hypothetical protein GCM10009836_46550 [Pseudonocardia ailaonensis]|uniref:Uncharacterized protein n=1 Tax=Pseudonocardia ailaonensis TaxID=367279 RepID=A0ABN2NBB7_9PSEU
MAARPGDRAANSPPGPEPVADRFAQAIAGEVADVVAAQLGEIGDLGEMEEALDDLAALYVSCPDDPGAPIEDNPEARLRDDTALRAATDAVETLRRMVGAFADRTAAQQQEAELRIDNLETMLATEKAQAAVDRDSALTNRRPLLGAVIRVGVVTLLSSVIGGPIAAFVTHAPLLEKIVETVFTSLIGSAAAEAVLAATRHHDQPRGPRTTEQWVVYEQAIEKRRAAETAYYFRQVRDDRRLL